MVVTFKKIMYQDLPDKIQKAIMEFGDGEIIVDETKITAEELKKLGLYFAQDGYKSQ